MLFMYIKIKIRAPLVLSVDNRYIGLIRAKTSYDKNGVRGKFLMEGGYFLNQEVNTICPFCPDN